MNQDELTQWVLTQAKLNGMPVRKAGYIGKSPQTCLIDVQPNPAWADPDLWGPKEVMTIYVHADHHEYGLCLTVGSGDDQQVLEGYGAEPDDFRDFVSAATGIEVPETVLPHEEIVALINTTGVASAGLDGDAVCIDIGGRRFHLHEDK